MVAIPSNRVNVSYEVLLGEKQGVFVTVSRNPLKSGQCFLPYKGS